MTGLSASDRACEAAVWPKKVSVCPGCGGGFLDELATCEDYGAELERVPVLPASVADELALMLGWALDWIADAHEIPLADEEPVDREKFDRATAAVRHYQDTKEAGRR